MLEEEEIKPFFFFFLQFLNNEMFRQAKLRWQTLAVQMVIMIVPLICIEAFLLVDKK